MKVNQIITGDCVSIMETWDDEVVDLILTSPPYNVGLNYEGFDDNLSEIQHQEFTKMWLSELYRVAKDGARLYAIISGSMLWWFKDRAIGRNWRFIQKLTWCKPNLVGGTNKITGDWNLMTEDILLFRKGSRIPMIGDKSVNTFNWFMVPIPQSNYKDGRSHPAQLPLKLCKMIIARTPGQVVLDPFAGSGQVLRAAKSLGRDYIGIELVDTVAEKARRFVNNAKLLNNESQGVLMDV